MNEWFGELPEGWEQRKINELFTERFEKVTDLDFAPLSVSKAGIVPQIATVAKSNTGDNRKRVCQGDFVINSRSDRRGSSGISKYDGSVSLINIVLRPQKEENERYFHYLLRSHIFIEEYYHNGRGIVADLWTTRYTEMKTIRLPLPPRTEQDQIVRYLDWKVSQINKLINAKKKQIALLQEQKQAVINEAVTSVGKDWEYHKLKRLVSDITEKDSPAGKFYVGMENVKSWTGEFIDTNPSAEGDSKKFTDGDVLFGKLRPYLAKVYAPDKDGVCSGEFLVLRGFKGYLPYLKYFLLSYDFIMLVNASTYGAKMPRANWDFIGNCIINLPLMEKQKIIAKHIENDWIRIDKAVTAIQGQITLLHEYRTRLISDVVTGKLDVRGITVPDFETIVEEAEITDDNLEEMEVNDNVD